MSEGWVTVLGGINVDISGTADARLILGDSNPGHVRISLGGVGRNIAENLIRLGQRVRMVTALGDDDHAARIRRACDALGLDLSLSETFPGARSNTYLCINDTNGDVLTAIADMELCEKITPAFLEKRLDVLNASELIIVDANLPASALAFLASACTAPLMADAVSIQKAPRLLPCLHRLQAVKPNRSEAECLTNVQIRGTDGLEEAALTLLREGVENVFITLGSQGVYYMNRDTAGIQPCLSGTVVNTNGCGDAFFAAAALALSRGLPISRAALLGQACAAVCAEADSAVNPNLSLDRIERKAGLKR